MKDNNWNVYTFTKVLAERMLEKERGDIPLVIVRPSIVTAAAQEPITLESIDYMTETIGKYYFCHRTL
jgi:nucleoside-diphosphate-sugar epimerase